MSRCRSFVLTIKARILMSNRCFLVLLLQVTICFWLLLGAVFIIYTNPSSRLIKTKLPPWCRLHRNRFDATVFCRLQSFLALQFYGRFGIFVAFQWATAATATETASMAVTAADCFRLFKFSSFLFNNFYKN